MCVIHVFYLFAALSRGVGALHVSVLYFYTALNEDLNKFCIYRDIQIDMRLLTVVIKRPLSNCTVLLNLEDVPQAELCTLHLQACQVRVTAGNSGLCCCIYVMYFER